jgi:hypothetical protein
VHAGSCLRCGGRPTTRLLGCVASLLGPHGRRLSRPTLVLVSTAAMSCGEDEKALLRALVEGAEVADIGRRAPQTATGATERKAA